MGQVNKIVANVAAAFDVKALSDIQVFGDISLYNVLPNLIGVVVLMPLVMKITKNYVDRKIKKQNIDPVLSYDPQIQEEAEEAVNEENE